MSVYRETAHYTLYLGKMQDELTNIADSSIDAIVTDPPYELNFMNKGWDNSGVAFQKDTWERCLRVLKPGGHLLAFGGSRTFHRIAVAIEDAGFEIRDTIMWLYGSGFPKSMNIGLAIDKSLGAQGQRGKEWGGWGTALKPAYEPIIVARKPVDGSVVNNILKYGVGGFNIDECRVGTGNGCEKPEYKPNMKNNVYGHGLGGGEWENTNGRFPANIITDGSDEVAEGFPETKSTGGSGEASIANSFKNVYGEYKNNITTTSHLGGLGDEGSASRYFYCAKASKKDRDEGLNGFEEKTTGELQGGRKYGSAGSIMKNADGGTRVNPFAGAGGVKRNTHPTVKPTELMQYLVRLVSSKGATILDPFMGSGSTGKAVMIENLERDADYKFIGIEMTEEYLPIAEARIRYWTDERNLPIEDKPTEKKDKGNYQFDVFDFIWKEDK